MRNFFAIVTSVALLAGTAARADSDGLPGAAPLAPGHAAGVKNAQDDRDNTIIYIVGLGAVAVGIALLVSDNGNKNAAGGGGGGGGTTTTTTQ